MVFFYYSFFNLYVKVFYHGGGFCLGSAENMVYQIICRSLANRSKCIVVSIEYRLAPEFKYGIFSFYLVFYLFYFFFFFFSDFLLKLKMLMLHYNGFIVMLNLLEEIQIALLLVVIVLVVVYLLLFVF